MNINVSRNPPPMFKVSLSVQVLETRCSVSSGGHNIIHLDSTLINVSQFSYRWCSSFLSITGE